MANHSQIDVTSFHENGYVHLKSVFSPEEMSHLRKKLEAVKQTALASGIYKKVPAYPKAVFILGDPLTWKDLEDFDYIIFHRRIVDCVKQILGEELVYFGDSSIQAGEGGRGFHKDNVDRHDGTAPDWQGEYNLIRLGLYFQDHSRYSGGLKLRRQSHLFPTDRKGKAIDVPTELGDVIIWNLRTTHSGNNVRLRFLRGLCLHPRLEGRVPFG